MPTPELVQQERPMDHPKGFRTPQPECIAETTRRRPQMTIGEAELVSDISARACLSFA
jgi:hypothetical protein